MCQMYRDEQASSFDTIRAKIFLTSNKPEKTPPTSDAAKLHIAHDFLQASKWSNASVTMNNCLPTPYSSGGFLVKEGKVILVMMTLEPIPQAGIEVITCEYKSDCQTRRFCCFKAKMNCSLLCHKVLKHNSAI